MEKKGKTWLEKVKLKIKKVKPMLKRARKIKLGFRNIIFNGKVKLVVKKCEKSAGKVKLVLDK